LYYYVTKRGKLFPKCLKKRPDPWILVLDKGNSGEFVDLLLYLTIGLYPLMPNNRIISSEYPYYPGIGVNATLIVYSILTICYLISRSETELSGFQECSGTGLLITYTVS
jgi:hypothetical protein